MSLKDECSTGSTNILGEQIILDNRYKFIFIQFHLSIFLSFTGRYCAVVLDGLTLDHLRSSYYILVHLCSLEVDSDKSEACLDDKSGFVGVLMVAWMGWLS